MTLSELLRLLLCTSLLIFLTTAAVCVVDASNNSKDEHPPASSHFGRLSWPNASWADDGTAQIPLGNGDVTAGVWVSNSSSTSTAVSSSKMGDLRLLISSSSAINENSQPVKTGVIRIRLDPPLIPPEASDDQFSFCQTFDPTTASLTITTFYYKIVVYVDANAPMVRVDIDTTTTTTAAVTTSDTRAAGPKPFDVVAKLEPYRKYEISKLGWLDWRETCGEPQYDHYDTIVQDENNNNTIVWYHKNPTNASTRVFERSLRQQGVTNFKGLINPFCDRIFGGSLYGSNLVQGANNHQHLSLVGKNLTKASVQVALLARVPTTEAKWWKEMASIVQNDNSTHSPSLAWKNHVTTWEALWNRSHVVLKPRRNSNSTNQTHIMSTTKLINAHLVWNRYLTLIQARHATVPIKFNGQAFIANPTGKGWDYREWGSGYWFQNTRQPYFNALMDGDVDVLDHSLLDFYHTMLPHVQARTFAQFRDTQQKLPYGAAFFPETTTAFGTYPMSEWGCNTSAHPPFGAADSKWIRFHWTGGLELSLLILDRFTWTNNVTALEQHLEIISSVMLAYMHRYPIIHHRNNNTHNNNDGTTPTIGTIDIFPAQSLETWQCPNPANRSDCVTNPTPEIAGLRAVLTRLLQLPNTVKSIDNRQRQLWRDYLQALPPIPTRIVVDQGKVDKSNKKKRKRHPVRVERVIWPGEQLPPQSKNKENPELYTVHPYRLYGVGKANLSLAQATYRHRRFPCNNGWCQDIVDAAMLNLTDETARQIQDRTLAEYRAEEFRFPGFAAHLQDFEPSLDHYTTLRTAVNYMLLSPLDDDDDGVILFPGFPSHVWDVDFRLHGPDNTMIEATCENGQVTHLVVTPPEKRKHIKQTGNCRMAVSTAKSNLDEETPNAMMD